MKGIILAGGAGTRLYPNTKVISKQLLPIYDKPMIYYPLSTLLLGGIKDIGLISTPRDIPMFREMLGNGNKYGLNIEYFEQPEPRGLADAFLICEDFIGNDNCCLILGDNIFYGNMQLMDIFSNFKKGALVFGYPVKDPERYGVLSFGENGEVHSITEKPKNPPSNFAVPGLYLYDNNVVEYAKSLAPSKRGEIEITDLNNIYLKNQVLNCQLIGRGVAWLDAGTCESLQDAGNFIMSIEKRQSYKIACIEEICFRQGFISFSEFESLSENYPESDYKQYLQILKKEFKSSK